MEDFKDVKLYNNTSFATILKEIHVNQKNKEAELRELINNLKPFIGSAGDAVIVVPLIQSYLNTAVKNDENLIKMATIVQRAVSTAIKNDKSDLEFSEEEKEQLLKTVQDLKVV